MNGYRLSLDIHPEVLGWALQSMDDNLTTDCQSAIFDMGVRVFSEGRESERNGKIGMSLGAGRRAARQVRKNRRRSKRRKQTTANELIRSGLLPEDRELRNRLKNEHPDCINRTDMDASEKSRKNREWNPLYLRFQALERRLEPFELGRIIMHLCVHRGYRSIDLDSVSGQTLERKKNLLKIRELERHIQLGGCRTLGEFLWRKTENNYRCDDSPEQGLRETIRFKPDMLQVFPSRGMYQAEFDLIAQKQEPYFSEVRWDVLRRLIFYQRSLKMPERSFCPYYFNHEEPQKSEYRGFRAQPSAHRFKIAQTLQNCTYIDKSNMPHPLDQAQKEKLAAILENQKSLSFSEAAKQLNLPTEGYFTAEKSHLQKFSGNEISCDMRKPERFNSLWDYLCAEEQDEIIELLIYGGKQELNEKLEKTTLTKEQCTAILKYEVKTALAPYSALFMRQVSSHMLENNCTYDEAVAILQIHTETQFTENAFNRLPPYGQILPEIISVKPQQNYGKTWSPTMHAVFNQLRTVINALIERYGKPDEIILQIASQVKKTRDGRDLLLRRNEFRHRDIEKTRQLFLKLGAPKLRRRDYVAYKLWKELPNAETYTSGGKLVPVKTCLLCGKQLFLEDIIAQRAETTFIIPFAHSLNSTGGNLMLAHTECVRKKGTKTPFDAFAEETGSFSWELILERASHLRPQKRILFASNVPAYNFFDASYPAQKIVRYLSAICKQNNITAYTAGIPKLANGTWQLQNLCSTNKANRFGDYRSYALNALALNGMDTTFLEQLKNDNQQTVTPQNIIVPAHSFLTEIIRKKLQHLLVSHKPNHSPNGKFFDETALGKHMYYCSVEEQDFKRSDIPYLVNVSLQKQMLENSQKYGWKKTKFMLFNRERSRVIIQKPSFVTRKKLLLCSELDINRIINPNIRKDMLNLAAVHIGNQWYHAVERYIRETGIRRVRVIPKGQEAVFIPSAHNKAYVPADFLFADIWRIPQKNHAHEHRGVFVSRIEAVSYLKENKKPHPAAKFICRLYKNDTLKIYSDITQAYYARVAGFATTQQKIDIRPLSAASAIPLWNEQIAKNLVEGFWTGKKSAQNHTAINSIFSANFRVVKTVISPEGKIRG